ncbi:MAG: glycyl-tRNA synthetase [Patescibacteria group bacterium]|jgi:glycyl-tRNA synthetase
MTTQEITVEEITNFAKRKGLIFPSAEIYGGLAGFWDYGPLGSELKKNLKDQWWKYHVHMRDDVTGIDGSIITHPKVWEASGHIASFVDVAVICTKCKTKSKVDPHEVETAKCEKCGADYENKGEFNPMFTTDVGPIKEDATKAYLRPETAQLIFANFKQVTDTARVKLPFGIAQIGKAFRNEIAPRNFIFRCREFEQMEIEYFIDPSKKNECPYEFEDIEILVYDQKMQEGKAEAKLMKISNALKDKIIKLPWHAYWLATELHFFKSLGISTQNLRIRQHEKDEKSHYATDTWDIEYKFPFGYKEVQGIADRGIYDLTQHQEHSKKSLELLDEATKQKILPMVISEPSLGVERILLVLLFEAFKKDKDNPEKITLTLNPKLAPVKAAIFPLIKKDEAQVQTAKEIVKILHTEFNVTYDQTGSVGRRYARNDEAGTPFCITVDPETKEDNQVTIRDRDTGEQKRIAIEGIKDTIRKLISQETTFQKL